MDINVYKRFQCSNCSFYSELECPADEKDITDWIPVFVDENNIELRCPCFVRDIQYVR